MSLVNWLLWVNNALCTLGSALAASGDTRGRQRNRRAPTPAERWLANAFSLVSCNGPGKIRTSRPAAFWVSRLPTWGPQCRYRITGTAQGLIRAPPWPGAARPRSLRIQPSIMDPVLWGDGIQEPGGHLLCIRSWHDLSVLASIPCFHHCRHVDSCIETRRVSQLCVNSQTYWRRCSLDQCGGSLGLFQWRNSNDL